MDKSEKMMADRNRVCVLLSTFNGEKYIESLLKSVLSQKNVELMILVRDDGSTDSTKDILSNYKEQHKNIKCFFSENIGVEKSFTELCRYALNEEGFNYYAFCDQDDIWLPNKLERAISNIYKEDVMPNLYFSNLLVVDEQLENASPLFGERKVHTSKDYSMLQLFVYGCTCVFNRCALEYYVDSFEEEFIHDNWLYEICVFLGNVYYDKGSYIKYRQHSTNASGSKKAGIALFKQRFRKIFLNEWGHNFEAMSRKLLEKYSDQLSIEDKIYLSRLVNYRSNIKDKLYLVFSSKYKCEGFIKNIRVIARTISNHL